MKLWSWSEWVVVSGLLVLPGGGVRGASSLEGEMAYFGKGIDYWNEAAPATRPPATDTSSSVPVAPGNATPDSREDQGFSWKKYLDPKTKEFFREGDYLPPEPFMEIVRDPTDRNLKLWFEYMGKKNALAQRLQERMKEYLGKSTASVPAEGRETINRKLSQLPRAALGADRFRFRMYFDSKCPHCKKMLGTLSDLRDQGYFVELRQTDSDPQALAGIPFPVERASASELKEKSIQSVPVLLVGDLKRKLVYRITGYQTAAQVLGAIPKEAE